MSHKHLQVIISVKKFFISKNSMFITMKVTIAWDVTACSPDVTSIWEDLAAYILGVEE
jgi:hypothetical protein